MERFVIVAREADVTGDGVHDKVYLMGKRFKHGETPIRDITLVIEDGKTGRVFRISLPDNQGYAPALYLADFTRDKVADILVSIDSGSSGGFKYYYIFTFSNYGFIKVFDWDDFNRTYNYTVTFNDNYHVAVYSTNLNSSYDLDISGGKDMHRDIYDENGRLLKPVSGFVPGLVALYPVNPHRGGYDLRAVEPIVRQYSDEIIGYVQTVLGWDGSRFTAVNQMVKRAMQ